MGSRAALGLLCLALAAGCRMQGATPCDAIGARNSVITPGDYQGCAREVMAELDALAHQATTFVHGDASMRPTAVASATQLRRLLQRAGLERDILSPGRAIERWPDSRLRAFNSAVVQAAFAYQTSLEVGKNVPASYNRQYLDEGWHRLDEARSCYAQVW